MKPCPGIYPKGMTSQPVHRNRCCERWARFHGIEPEEEQETETDESNGS